MLHAFEITTQRCYNKIHVGSIRLDSTYLQALSVKSTNKIAKTGRLLVCDAIDRQTDIARSTLLPRIYIYYNIFYGIGELSDNLNLSEKKQDIPNLPNISNLQCKVQIYFIYEPVIEIAMPLDKLFMFHVHVHVHVHVFSTNVHSAIQPPHC